MNAVTQATNDMYMNTAKEIVANWMNEHIEKAYPQEIDFSANDMYIVWFCKTLQNWKALVSTDVRHGWYFEVTANGDKQEIYLDAYQKKENVCYNMKDYGYN